MAFSWSSATWASLDLVIGVKSSVLVWSSAIGFVIPIRPDGLPPLFYQKFWPSIGEDVSKAVLNCLNSGSIPSSINRTFITLIPKVNSPYVVSEFRPISLCNVIYKIVSKVAVNKLKKVLPFIISDSQSAFQSNKAISDNILVAFELLHHMKT